MKAEIAQVESTQATAVATPARPSVLVLEGSTRVGGGQRVTLDIVRWLQDQANFQVVVPGEGALEDALASEEIESRRIGYPAPAGRFGLLDRISYLPRGLASLRPILALVRDTKPDLLYATSRTALWAAIAGRLTGTPVVIHLHMVPPTRKTGWFLQRVCSMKSVKAVLVASSAIAERAGLPADKVRVCPNGVDTTVYRPQPELRELVRAELGIDERTHLTAVIGELSPEKGQMRAIEAFAELRTRSADVALVIVGAARDGNARYAEKLKEAASKLGLDDRVHFTGHREDISRLMNGIDLLLVPSQGRSGEACPMVVLEAWATGVPVLGTSTGGLPDLLGAGRGELMGNRSLAPTWASLIGSPDHLQKLSQKGLDAVAGQYSQKAASNRVLAVIEEAIAA